jgi:hypothetical protein
MRRVSFIGLLLTLLVAFSSCYYQEARTAWSTGGQLPWWCKSSEEIPVTSGPAVGNVDWYAGTHKQPLNWDQCMTMSAFFDHGRQFANNWKTRGAAEAAGWREVTAYIPGMGTHHVQGGITPAMLASPSFNRLDPNLDNAGLDSTFDPLKPEVLQFGGNGSDARLVGFDYYVRTSTGRPPEGFPGNLDWWHHHPWICHRRSDAAMVAFNTSDANCTSLGGVNVYMGNFYMLHVWVLEDMKFIPDVFAGQMPCISGGTAIHDDPTHWCHTSRTAPATAAAAGARTTTAAADGATRHRYICSLLA